MADALVEGSTHRSVADIERLAEQSMQLSRLEAVGRRSQSQVLRPGTNRHSSQDKGGSATSTLHVRYPTSFASASLVQIEIWDLGSERHFRATYIGREGPPSARAARKAAAKVARRFVDAIRDN
jgi:hypothetical protein